MRRRLLERVKSKTSDAYKLSGKDVDSRLETGKREMPQSDDTEEPDQPVEVPSKIDLDREELRRKLFGRKRDL